MTNAITITSDYGWKDPYVASLKGLLIREINEPYIVDITHDIALFNLRETSYVINNCFRDYPENSIHLVCVDEEISDNRKVLAMYFDKHYFVGVDNGLLSLIFQERTDYELFEIDNVLIEDAKTASEIFVKIAGHINRGGKLAMLGKKALDFKQLSLPKPSVKNNNQTIVGGIMYIDHFGNAITNISKTMFDEISKGRNFELKIPLLRQPITKVLNSYSEAKIEGKSIAVFNSSSLLEIAVYKPAGKFNNGAHTLLGLDIDDTIMINFKG